MTCRRSAVWLVFLAALMGLGGCATQSGVNKQRAAQANANLGAEFLQRGDNDQASAAFAKALQYDRRNFSANWGMAVVSERENEAAKAAHYFRKALSIQQSPTVFNSYAAFLCKQGQTSAAITNFRKALATRDASDRADTLANAGLCLTRAGQPQVGTGYFKKALQLNPNQVTALTQLARIEYHAHHYLQARAFIERADDATKLDADQLQLAAQIESALGDPSAAQAYTDRMQDAGQSATTPESSGQQESSQE